MQEYDLVEVTVTSPMFVDMDMFNLWVEGYSVNQACAMLSNQPSVAQFQLTPHMLTANVHDHFSQFTLLESGLKLPDSFIQDCTYHQLNATVRRQLIYRYYSLDDNLLRELVGKKLSHRSRRDLAEVAERCTLRIRSCRRQFDNLCRVTRRVEELPGRLADNIKTCFLLPDRLADCYAAMIFISANRFEMSKKSLTYITFPELAYCAGQLMTHWTASFKDPKGDASVCVDPDLQFFHELKELKALAEKKEYLDGHKSLVIRHLTSSGATNVLPQLDVQFKMISKAIITIASGLSHARELRDLFLDLVEKLIEPMRNLKWSTEDVHLFCTAYDATVKLLPLAKSSTFLVTWTRFFVPFSRCAEHLYHD